MWCIDHSKTFTRLHTHIENKHAQLQSYKKRNEEERRREMKELVLCTFRPTVSKVARQLGVRGRGKNVTSRFDPTTRGNKEDFKASFGEVNPAPQAQSLSVGEVVEVYDSHMVRTPIGLMDGMRPQVLWVFSQGGA